MTKFNSHHSMSSETEKIYDFLLRLVLVSNAALYTNIHLIKSVSATE